MTIFDLRNDEALDALVDIMDPFIEVFSDKEVVSAIRSGNKLAAVKVAIRNHKKEIRELLAKVDLKDPETYDIPFMALPVKLLMFFNRPEVKDLFPPQPKTEEESSGSVSGNTEVEEA